MQVTVHYAPHGVKCLSHRYPCYPLAMDTPNQRLRYLRERKFNTVEDGATFLGVNVNTYRQHENDTRNLGGIPRKAAERYAAKFKVSLDWLMTGKGDDPIDSVPSLEAIERMLQIALDAKVTLNTKLSDLPTLVAPALKESLEAHSIGNIFSTGPSIGADAKGKSVNKT